MTTRGDLIERLEAGSAAVHQAMIRIAELRAALKPFAMLAGNLDGAPNLIGLLTEAEFRRAAEAYSDGVSEDGK